jgi:uridine phosphorylase
MAVFHPSSLPHKGATMENNYPILEFDSTREAIIEPARIFKPLDDMPEHCVLCFFQNVIEQLVEGGLAREIKSFPSEQGPRSYYTLDCGLGRPVTLLHPGVGAAIAAASLEIAIALGGRKFVACGGAGVLDRSIAVGHLVVPTSAVRDEGTSYHYLPAGREVSPAPEAVGAIEAVLRRRKVDHLLAKTWTTDGLFRETRAKTEQRRAEGCLTVEMEAAAFFAVAQFRGVPVGQILYGGDNLDAEEWDRRDWMDRASVREQLVFLAAEACLEMG